MKTYILSLILPVLCAVSVNLVAQKSDPALKGRPQEATVVKESDESEAVRENGLRRVATGDGEFELNIDAQVETAIENSVEMSMEVMEQMEVNMENIEMNFEATEVEIPEIELDPISMDLEIQEIEPLIEEELEVTTPQHWNEYQGDGSGFPKDKNKDKHKDKSNKTKNKSEKDEKTKGLKKL